MFYFQGSFRNFYVPFLSVRMRWLAGCGVCGVAPFVLPPYGDLRRISTTPLRFGYDVAREDSAMGISR